MFIRIDDIYSFKTYREGISIFKGQAPENELVIKNGVSTFEGFSYPAQRMVFFLVNFDQIEKINWRETAICPITKLSTRKRILFHVFQEYFKPNPGSVIYVAENSEFSDFLRKKYRNTISSEYLGDNFKSGDFHNGIMHQDFINLSFESNSFDFIFHSDVFEHISDYLAGFKECFRVLKKGGVMIWTVPFSAGDVQNFTRAYVNEKNQIIHVHPPEYHGDPLDPKGILCFRYFGWQMFDELKNLGFRDSFALATWSREFVYLNEDNFCFVAIK